MNDAALAKLGEQKMTLEAEVATKKAEYDAVRAKITTELQRRGVKSITTRGVVLTLSEPEETVYDEIYLEAHLERRMWMSISRRVLDKDKLLAQISAKKIPARILKKATSIKKKAAYPTVTREKK